MTYPGLATLLRDSPEATLGSGVSDAVIVEAETRLRIPIRGAYRTFLKDFGWGGAGSLEILGLGYSVPAYLDLVAVTLSERLEMHPPLAEYLLPLANSGSGDLYCLDTRAAADPPVVLWDHTEGANQVPCEEASDFVAWAVDWLTAT